eukprot:6178030-Pleurochrysis_carterae.AAC.2
MAAMNTMVVNVAAAAATTVPQLHQSGGGDVLERLGRIMDGGTFAKSGNFGSLRPMRLSI